ncbi:MAG: NAD+ synthase [Chlamydiota bacterium]
MRYLLAQINPTVGDLARNTAQILNSLERAKRQGCDLVVFPEMALTGYPPEDLLLLQDFQAEVDRCYGKILEACSGIAAILGTIRRNPSPHGKPLCNSALVIADQKVVGYYDKQLLPAYDVFDEVRYFAPGSVPFSFTYKNRKIGIVICEDLWEENAPQPYGTDPLLALQGASLDCLVQIAASPYHLEQPSLRKEVLSRASRALKSPLLACNQVGANDALIFDGRSCHFSSKGELIAEAGAFVEEDLVGDLEAARPKALFSRTWERDVIEALALGISDYFVKQGWKKALVGLSGGIDSALVLYLAVKALGSKQVQALFLPSRFTRDGSKKDSLALARNLEVACQTIDIEPLFCISLKTLYPHIPEAPFGVMEENLQSRIRSMLLMAYSNKTGHLLLNTGNKSELAMGYTTLYGDLCGAIGVIGDVKKTDIYALCAWIDQEEGGVFPATILSKEPSAELREGQKDRDTLPPYPLLDAVITRYIEEGLSPREIAEKERIDLATVTRLVAQIHRAEYKRRQAPFALRVSKKAFHRGRVCPIVQGFV